MPNNFRRYDDMTRKQRRLAIVVSGLGILGIAVALTLNALSDSIVFFYGPSEVAEKVIPIGARVRVGGLVAEGSVSRADSDVVTFVITDGKANINVRYRGILPDLFAEGEGVVAQGAFDANRAFNASEVLAKHDETYMPPEVVDALKRAGTWRESNP